MEFVQPAHCRLWLSGKVRKEAGLVNLDVLTEPYSPGTCPHAIGSSKLKFNGGNPGCELRKHSPYLLRLRVDHSIQALLRVLQPRSQVRDRVSVALEGFEGCVEESPGRSRFLAFNSSVC